MDDYAGVALTDTLDQNAVTNDELAVQDLDALGVENLRVDTFEIMSRQATINIGTIGHVAHGKTTVVKALSEVKTQKYHDEVQKNITIRLGYGNSKVFECPNCPRPQCYQTHSSWSVDKVNCKICQSPMTLRRHFSFVDCPGHHVLMATMLNGAAIMDAALLLVAANEEFPQPQTLEHLNAVDIMRLRNVIVVQNKIDLVTQVTAHDQYRSIKSNLKKWSKKYPVIPVSAQLHRNVDYLLDYLLRIPLPHRNFCAPSRMTIIRSFDVNKPGESDINHLKGGVAGGTIIQGVIRVNEDLEVRPGQTRHRNTVDGRVGMSYLPYRTRAVSLKAEMNQLQYAVSGGLIAVGTTLDPSLARQDKLMGQLIGNKDGLPAVYVEIEVEYYLFAEMVGTKGESRSARRVAKLTRQDLLQINVGTFTCTTIVLDFSPTRVQLQLTEPGCANIGDHVAISRKLDNHFRLIGWGVVCSGKAATCLDKQN